MSQDECGIVYVAAQRPRFTHEAIASAQSAKEHLPDVPICLFTDMPETLGSSIAPFDTVITFDPEDTSAVDSPDVDPLDAFFLRYGITVSQKIVSMRRSPYDKTLYIDTDTRLRSPKVRRVFDYLETYAMAITCCTPDTSRRCGLFGPMFNGGVIAFRKDPLIEKLLVTWEELHRRNQTLALRAARGDVSCFPHLRREERVFLLVGDQTSLATILSPSTNEYGIPVKVLDGMWNARSYPRDSLDGIIIDHADCHKIVPGNVEPSLKARFDAWIGG